MVGRIFTVGHSNHELDRFINILRWNDVGAICDVRSVPWSRYVPHFNKIQLGASLARYGIHYFFLGDQLGARPRDRRAYVAGRVSYDRLAALPDFQGGIERVVDIHRGYAPALLCSERDPVTCHRAILVARHLVLRGYCVEHITPNGDLETHSAAMDRLIRALGIPDADMWRSRKAVEEEAYRLQGDAIAFREERAEQNGSDLSLGDVAI